MQKGNGEGTDMFKAQAKEKDLLSFEEKDDEDEGDILSFHEVENSNHMRRETAQ
jgi:hypothetical protein